MNQVDFVFKLPEELAAEAKAFGLLNEDEIARLIAEEIERKDEALEALWEESLLKKDFAAAFREDGSVDFALLKAKSSVMRPEDLEAD